MNWFENKTTQIIALVGIVTEIKTDIATIKAEISSLQQKIAENNKNPLSG